MPCTKCGKKEYCSGFCKSHFMEYFEKKVRYTIRRFSLIGKKDKVAVAVSGGKDSTVLLYLLHKFGYGVEGITVTAFGGKHSDKNVENLRAVCEKHGIPLTEYLVKEELGHSVPEIKKMLAAKGVDQQMCALCGVLRRQMINRHAKAFDVVATGHTMDDEAQAFLMNVFRNDTKQVYRGGPRSSGKGFVPRIKPLYLIKESETAAYSRAMGFPVQYSRCPYSIDAYRRNFRGFLDEFEKKHPNAKNNIVNFYLSEFWGKKAGTAPKVCKACGEPSSGETCKACQIIGRIK
ncbi:MAG: TIGR00269 family protein [Candidatus Diapherotrites archaeon]|nr:TIGR00269 family protein [Candidatus Diapherotrites archaeon]